MNPADSGSARTDVGFAERYSRQILFAGIGAEGQKKLAASHVAIVGCGATGAAAASLLARAGVGTLTLIDRDYVEESNLQRQVLFDEADALAALPKAEAARRKISRFNGSIRVHAQVADLVPGNIHELLRDADLVLDGTDNFETRYLINDYAVEQGRPWIYAAALGAYAATMNILPGASPFQTACLACIFPKPPAGTVETCDTAGILTTAVNLTASIQVTEALKYLIGAPAKCGAPCWRWIFGAISGQRSRPPSGGLTALSAGNGISPISAARIGHILPSAGETPSKSMSIAAPSISPSCNAASSPTVACGTTPCCSALSGRSIQLPCLPTAGL